VWHAKPLYMPKHTVGALVLTALAVTACGAERSSAVAPQMAAAPILIPLPPATTAVNPVERHAGDFLVHMISGSFRKQPALFTERVVAQEGDNWIMEYKLEDNDGARTLRSWVDPNGEITRVSIVTDAGEKPGTIADYDALMASASLAPDENVGLTASTQGTCMVGPSELDCETKSYRVLLGDKEANLGITGSRALPGLDLAGEITTADGTVIYRSTLIEHGNESNSKDQDSFALADPSTP
jgi:hypothetical protein